MHLRHVLLAEVVSLGLLALAVAPALGQTDGVTWVTGTMRCATLAGGTSESNDALTYSQHQSRCIAKMSDPRVSGTWQNDIQQVCFNLPGEPCMLLNTTELVGPDGTWVGSGHAVNDVTLTALPGVAVLEGTGAYDGWTYVFSSPSVIDPEAEASGILYEGPPPPWAETLPLAPAE